MGIKNIMPVSVGHASVDPAIIYIDTDDTTTTVLTANYLTPSKKMWGHIYSNKQMALVSVVDSGATQTIWAEVHVATDGNVSLTAVVNPGNVILPVVDGDFAIFSGTTGLIKDAGYSPTDATKTKVVMANAAVIANHIAVFTDTAGTIADDAATAINDGNIQAGVDASAGTFISFPATTASGTLIYAATDNAAGDFDTTITNAASVGQDQVISVPDSGAATANFLLDTGAANILTDFQQFVGLNDVLLFSVGTWTTTRGAQGNYYSRKSQADETAVIGIDITNAIRTTASKGFRLASFDVICGITNAALDAHSVTLDRIEYADNVAVSVNSVAITGTLPTATQANPYVTNVAIDTPAFDNTADSKYVIELTVDAAATSDYDYYGIMLKFAQTIA